MLSSFACFFDIIGLLRIKLKIMNPFSKLSGEYEKLRELSAQLVIAEALKRKVQVEILDFDEQLIRLQKGNHAEYLEGGTVSTRESHLSNIIVDNKYVCKKIMKEGGISTPEGKRYFEKKLALEDYPLYQNLKIVVKPKTTNCGIGISILEPGVTLRKYQEAVEAAFGYDQSIIIEEFVEGIECRFLVINGKTVGVLRRIPAHVIGDGKNSIKKLTALKNKDPRRGEGEDAPLSVIRLGKVEKSILMEQHLSVDSIPRKGQQIFLRYNSNISSGGDCIDYTDLVHPGYKKLAEKTAIILQKTVCGVDMIMSTFTKAPTAKNYSIIEVNKNPSLCIHDFPSQGENRHIEKYILDFLGF